MIHFYGVETITSLRWFIKFNLWKHNKKWIDKNNFLPIQKASLTSKRCYFSILTFIWSMNVLSEMLKTLLSLVENIFPLWTVDEYKPDAQFLESLSESSFEINWWIYHCSFGMIVWITTPPMHTSILEKIAYPLEKYPTGEFPTLGPITICKMRLVMTWVLCLTNLTLFWGVECIFWLS